jgi:hypothetical protein
MHVKPLLPSRKITRAPCASVSTIRADLEMSSGPADIARAIFACVVLSGFVGILFCEAFDSARPSNLIPIIRNRAIAVMALAKNLRLELWALILVHPRKRQTFQFMFGLKPIVEFTARLFAALKIDFVCATSDIFFKRCVSPRNLSRFRLLGAGLGFPTYIVLQF